MLCFYIEQINLPHFSLQILRRCYVCISLYLIYFFFADPFEGMQFSPCSKSCGGGERYRFNHDESTKQTIRCNTHSCQQGSGVLLYAIFSVNVHGLIGYWWLRGRVFWCCRCSVNVYIYTSYIYTVNVYIYTAYTVYMYTWINRVLVISR